MKKIRLEFKCVTLAIFLICITVHAGFTQPNISGLAGPDKHTCKSSSSMFTTVPVKIGPSTVISDWCYHWTPTDGLSDPHSANPMAAPAHTTIYTLHVVGPDFTWEVAGTMTVFIDVINSITVTPKQCCFKVGEAFTPNQFNITTNPPGLENNVTFTPASAPFIISQTAYVSITASTKCYEWGDPVTTQFDVEVVNENALNTTQLGIANLLQGLGKVKDAVEKYSSGVNVPGNPCQIPSPSATWVITAQVGFMCCPGNGCVKDKFKFSGTYKACWGLTCDFPFYGVPGVASLNLALLANICMGVGIDYRTTCDGGDICLTGQPEINLGGGISGTILGGSVAKASLMLVNQINAPTFQFCVPSYNFSIIGTLCYQLDIVGSIKFLSAYTSQVKVPLIPKVCF